MPQNHSKHNLVTTWHPNIHRCPKDPMTENKYSERPPLTLTNLVQIPTWSFRHQEIQLTNVQIFSMDAIVDMSNMTLHPNHKIILNTEYCSLKYAHLQQKQIFMPSLSKMVIYTSKKAQNCKNCLAYWNSNIYWYIKKVTQEKVIILENLY